MHDVLVVQRCQRSSCFTEVDFKKNSKSAFMRLIMLNIYAQHRGALCSVVLSSPRWLLDIQPSTLCLLSSSYFPCSSLNTHLLSLLPPGKFDSWVLCAKNGHTRTSVITPNIYISSSTYLFFFSILSFSSPLSFSVCVQLMADWTLVMLVCCWLRDEAPTLWLTCESSKVSRLTHLNTKQYTLIGHVSNCQDTNTTLIYSFS